MGARAYVFVSFLLVYLFLVQPALQGEDLVAAVEKFDIGDTISLDVKTRDGSLKKVSVVLQDMVAEM